MPDFYYGKWGRPFLVFLLNKADHHVFSQPRNSFIAAALS